jgi:hypothetical protein
MAQQQHSDPLLGPDLLGDSEFPDFVTRAERRQLNCALHRALAALRERGDLADEQVVAATRSAIRTSLANCFSALAAHRGNYLPVLADLVSKVGSKEKGN